MKGRTAPEVHHNIIPAPSEGSIIEFYKGYYDCVYIILHPFMKCHDIKKFMEKDVRHTKEEILQLTDNISWNKVVSLCGFKDIIPPEGNFSELLLDNMLGVAMELGHDWIYLGDEFGWERKLEYIHDIIENKVNANFHHESWYTPKNEILYTTHWDSHFTLLCSDKQTVEKILSKYPFEGFYCSEKTEIYWSLT